MARIRQFAKDMGLSYNKAKNLVNKGRKLKDGGSSVLESTMNKVKPVMAKNGKYKPKKSPTAKVKKEKLLTSSDMPKKRPKNFKKIVEDILLERGEITIGDLNEANTPPGGFTIEKKSTGGGFDIKKLLQLGQDISLEGRLPTKKDIEKAKKILKKRPEKKNPMKKMKMGGSNEKNEKSKKQDSPLKGDRKEEFIGRLPNKRKEEFIGRLPNKRKEGGGFSDLSGDGKVTKKDVLIGRGVIKKSRGGGIAIQGTQFRGVR